MSQVSITLSAPSSAWLGKFTDIEVERSIYGVNGPWGKATSMIGSGARLPSWELGAPPVPRTGVSVPVSGKYLELLLDETDAITVAFTGTNPLTLASVAAQVQAQSDGRLTAWVSYSDSLVLQTSGIGSGAAVRVVGGDAAALLGLATEGTDSVAYGTERHVQLFSTIASYTYTDLLGSQDYWYRTRYRELRTASAWSAPFKPSLLPVLAATSLVTASIKLLDLSGYPIPRRRVTIYNNAAVGVYAGALIAGQAVEAATDNSGVAVLGLVRGARVTLAVEGTGLTREFVVPEDVTITAIDLLDPTLSHDDAFRVRVPDIISAVRTS